MPGSADAVDGVFIAVRVIMPVMVAAMIGQGGQECLALCQAIARTQIGGVHGL